MWYLIEDFFDQSIVMQGTILFGWLCVLIMVASFASDSVPALWNLTFPPGHQGG